MGQRHCGLKRVRWSATGACFLVGRMQRLAQLLEASIEAAFKKAREVQTKQRRISIGKLV